MNTDLTKNTMEDLQMLWRLVIVGSLSDKCDLNTANEWLNTIQQAIGLACTESKTSQVKFEDLKF